MTKYKDTLSLLQSRIALRANFLAEYAPNGGTDWPAVEDQKADKKAVAEIVKLRREVNLLSNALDSVGDQLICIAGTLEEGFV
mgnify:CR=1 FL=1